MNKLKKCGVSAISLIIATALFLLPCSVTVKAAETDKNFWAMWWLEQKTGVDWSKYTGMDAGLTYGEYVYRQTGRTVDYAVDTVCNGVSYDKTKQFVYDTVEDTRQTAKDMYNNMPGYPGVVQDFIDEARDRIDSDGNVSVRGSDFWNSVYNDLYGDSGSTKDVYEETNSGEWNGTSNGMTYSISIINSDNTRVNGLSNTFTGDVFDQTYRDSIISFDGYASYFVINDNGNIGYINIAEDTRYRIISNIDNMSINGNILTINYTRTTYYTNTNDIRSQRQTLRFRYTTTDTPTQGQGSPVLQPRQVGFAIDPFTGIKYPIYTPYNPDSDYPAPPDNLPYTPNPDGTVTWHNPNPDSEHPENDTQDTDIYIDPDELTDDGWFLLLKWLTDNSYGTGTGGGYNGDGKPYNMDSLGDNATLLDVIKAGFKDLLNKLNPFGNLIDTIKNALKSFFNIDLTALTDFEIDIDFDILGAIWEKLLQMLGVT